MSAIVSRLPLTISETVTDKRIGSKGLQIGNEEMAYGKSNRHVTDDVTLPSKVKLMIPICLEPNISKTAGLAV